MADGEVWGMGRTRGALAFLERVAKLGRTTEVDKLLSAHPAS